MCRVYDGFIGKLDADWSSGRSYVFELAFGTEEVSGAA